MVLFSGRRPALAVLVVCGLAAALPAGAETATTDGVLLVLNPAEPAHGYRTVHLDEVWRRGGEDDEEVLFGVIFRALADDDGNTYLLDSQLSQVTVIDADGEVGTALSREGDGPGEVRRPTDMFLTGDERVGLAVGFPGRVVYVGTDGQPSGDMSLLGDDPSQGGFAILRGARCRSGQTVLGATLVSQNQQQGSQTRRPRIASHAADGSVIHVFHESSYELDFNERTFRESTQLDLPLRRFDIGPDGRVYVAPDREAYRIEVFTPDGEPDRIIERAYPEHRRTDEELEEWRRLFAASLRRVPVEVAIDLCPTAAPIDWVFGGLTVRDDGRLWVRTSRSARDQPDGVMVTYDVFDADGVFAEQVGIACPGDGKEDALFFAGEDRIILVTGFMDAVRAMFGGVDDGGMEEPQPMEVVCYRIR